MKCEELLAALNQYVDGELDPAICDPFQEHLKGCNPCQIVVDNIRQTIRLYKAEEQFELPPTLHRRLGRLLREQWKGKSDADRPLVEQAKAGDFAAMESLVAKYERQVFGVARRIVQQHQDAEEVVQQTFLSVLEHLGEFREESQFRTWLLRIARTTLWLCSASGPSVPVRHWMNGIGRYVRRSPASRVHRRVARYARADRRATGDAAVRGRSLGHAQ